MAVEVDEGTVRAEVEEAAVEEPADGLASDIASIFGLVCRGVRMVFPCVELC